MPYNAWKQNPKMSFAALYIVCREKLLLSDWNHDGYWLGNRDGVAYISLGLAIANHPNPVCLAGGAMSVDNLPTIGVADLPFARTADPADAPFWLAYTSAFVDVLAIRELSLCRVDDEGRLCHVVISDTALLRAALEYDQVPYVKPVPPIITPIRAPWKVYV